MGMGVGAGWGRIAGLLGRIFWDPGAKRGEVLGFWGGVLAFRARNRTPGGPWAGRILRRSVPSLYSKSGASFARTSSRMAAGTLSSLRPLRAPRSRARG